MLYSSPSVYILTTASMCNGGLATRENAIPIQCLQRKRTYLIRRTFVIWVARWYTRESAMNRQKYYWFHIKPTNTPGSQLLCWHSTLKVWQIPICEAHSPAPAPVISPVMAHAAVMPRTLSLTRHLRGEERDRVGATQNIGPLLNVMNIPVFSCSCPHQSSIIVMLLLPLLPESICIMLMTNINCFLIIMNQKYGKDLAGGETDREMGKNLIWADQPQTVTQTYWLCVFCLTGLWYFLRSVSVWSGTGEISGGGGEQEEGGWWWSRPRSLEIRIW